MTRLLALFVAGFVALAAVSAGGVLRTAAGHEASLVTRSRHVLPAIARQATVAALPPSLTWCTTRFVVDGDTLDVGGCADAGRVRLILVDAPETGGACFATEATAALKQLLPAGSLVGLESDVSNVDRYGRYLRYAWTDAGLVNESLVRDGFARLAVFPPDTRYLARIRAAQDEARAARRGLWAGCPVPSPAPPPGDSCDPSYPTVCIPPPPPDLDCSDVPYRRFEVLPPDPHRLDGDRNGIGCE